MAIPKGLFDQTLVNAGWFDETMLSVGWFDEDFIDTPSFLIKVSWAEFQVPPGVSGPMWKAWNGTSWITGTLKRWDGSSWVTANVKRWNGASWV